MNQPVTIILHKAIDSLYKQEVHQDEFSYTGNLDAKTAIQQAAHAFLATSKGEEVKGNNNGHFNWGDIHEIPNAHWKAHGLTLLENKDAVTIGSLHHVYVDNDESLLPEDEG